MSTEFDSQVFLDQFVVTLVETTHPGNIGAVARACKNMGIKQLRLVAPKDFPSDEALRRSSGAEDLLASAEVHDGLDSALSDCHVVVGASARTRNLVWPLLNPRDFAGRMCSEFAGKQKSDSSDEPEGNFQATRICLLFGQEASGLTNEELQRCHYHIHIPANPEYSSLNLAMAVQVICYELRMCALLNDSHDGAAQIDAIDNAESGSWDSPAANNSEVEGFLAHLEETLVAIGYHDPKTPRLLMARMRRLFQRARLDKMEVNILRGMLKAVLEKTK